MAETVSCRVGAGNMAVLRSKLKSSPFRMGANESEDHQDHLHPRDCLQNPLVGL